MSSPRSKTYKAGELLFRENDESRSLFLILHGRVSIRKLTDAGEVELGQVGQNQIVGELAFFDRKPRSAHAIAVLPTEVVEIPYPALDPIYNVAPDYLKKIMSSLATRLREADDTIRDLKERLGLKADPINKSSDVGETELMKVLAMTDQSTPSKK